MYFFKIFLTLLLSTQLHAKNVVPSPRTSIVLSQYAVPAGAAGVFVNAQCYGTNNRGTNNPMSQSSRIAMILVGSENKTLLIDFPSTLVRPGGVPADQECGASVLNQTNIVTPTGTISLQNLLQNPGADGINIVNALSVANLKGQNARVSFSCKLFPLPVVTNFSIADIQDYYAIQVFNTAISPTQYYGYNGVMDRGTKIDLKINKIAGAYGDSNKYLYINSSFPGEDGFCGGFHSPLMFFFEENVPAFSGVSTLLKGKSLPTTWVEENHPGFFLVHLKKPSMPIKAANLFGDTAIFSNGFEALKPLDSNKDNKISSADKEFKNLYLWQDKNANSKNDKGELTTLKSHNISEIELGYNASYYIEYASAIFKGKSKFVYKDSSGKQKEGVIYDVYFSDKR